MAGDHVAQAMKEEEMEGGQWSSSNKSPMMVLDQVLSSSEMIATPTRRGVFKWLLVEAAPLVSYAIREKRVAL